MRLVKINDIILNMDNVAVIKGKDTGDGEVIVYAYTVKQEICLGICRSREEYQQLINIVYKELGESFVGEMVYIENNEKELWV